MRTGREPSKPASTASVALLARVVAVHVVEDLQPRAGQPRRVQQPAGERFGLVAVAEGEQRAHGERGVAQPAVAIVPVEVAAEPLGQRRGRRGDDRARRRVDEQLERERAAEHGPGERARRSRTRAAHARHQSIVRVSARSHGRPSGGSDRRPVVGEAERRVDDVAGAQRARRRGAAPSATAQAACRCAASPGACLASTRRAERAARRAMRGRSP